MRHTFRATQDRMLYQDKQVQIYHKSLEQPVYVVEPVDGTPTATILWLHGLLEHAYRFFPHAMSWARAGYQVILFHLKGHGIDAKEFSDVQWLAEGYIKTTEPALLCEYLGRRSDADPTFFASVRARNYRRLGTLKMQDHLDQTFSAIDRLANLTINKGPLMLGGHSLGGLIAAEAAAQLADKGDIQPAGVILLNPGLRPGGPSLLTRLPVELSWWGRVSPAFIPLSAPLWVLMMLKLPFNTGWGSRYVSDIKAEQALHAADPLISRRVPSTYLMAIQRQMAITRRRAADYPADLILLASKTDRIVHGRSSARFGEKVKASRGDACEVHLFTDTYAHELLRSTKRKEAARHLEAWLAKRVAGR